VQWGNGETPNRQRLGERGAGAIEYIIALLLIAAVTGAIVASPVAGQVKRYTLAALCRVGEAGGLGKCASLGPPPTSVTQPVVVDPDIPTGTCLASIDNEYLQPGFNVGVWRNSLSFLQDGGSQITLRKYILPNGTPRWEVWDMGWSDAGVLAQLRSSRRLAGSAGVWASLAGTNTKIYEFDNEQDALAFQRQQRDYRIGSSPGSWARVAIRTLPVTGAITRLLGALPWVGDDIEDFMGGREPDRRPNQEYYDGGLWLGGFNDVGPSFLPVSLVGRDWATASAGYWKYNDSGDKTFYVQASNQLMESVEFDLEPIFKALKLDKKAGADVTKGLEEAQKKVVAGLVAQYVRKNGSAGAADFERRLNARFTAGLARLRRLPAPLLRGLATDSGAGIGGRATHSVWYGITYDKNNNLKSFTEVDDQQLSWHYRVDAEAGAVSAWYQESLGGERTRTTKTVDLTDPAQRAALQAELAKLGQGPVGMVQGFTGLSDLFDRGVGTMARTTYDYDVRTVLPSASLDAFIAGAGLSFEWEENHSRLTEGQYWKPGVGWVPWNQCGLG
jgi:hypothetical protein